jgi:hypothetical protein
MENNWAAEQLHIGGGPIVVAGAEIGSLRNAGMRSDRDRGEIIDPNVFAEPAVVANFEVPGEFDSNAWLYVDALADTGSEQAKDGAL